MKCTYQKAIQRNKIEKRKSRWLDANSMALRASWDAADANINTVTALHEVIQIRLT